MKPETIFRNRVRKFFYSLQYTVAVPIQQVALCGYPDFILCCHGRFVALELKTDIGQVRPLQDYILGTITRAHGVSLVARPDNWDVVKAKLIRLDQGAKE